MPKLKETEMLYVRSMGKALRVTAIFDNDDEANAYMAQPGNDDAVVAVFGKFVLLARKWDKGIALPRA